MVEEDSDGGAGDAGRGGGGASSGDACRHVGYLSSIEAYHVQEIKLEALDEGISRMVLESRQTAKCNVI